MKLLKIKNNQLSFLYWITFGHVVLHWYVNLFSLILPKIKIEFGLSAVELGSLTTIQIGIATGVMVIIGYIADTFTNRTNIILIFSIFILGISYFIIGTFNSYISILISTSLIGVSIALWHPTAMGKLSIKFPTKRGMALSIHGVGASIGDSLSPLIVGFLITIFAWKTVMQFHLIPIIIFCLFLWKALKKNNLPEIKKPDICPKCSTENINNLKSCKQCGYAFIESKNLTFNLSIYLINMKNMLNNKQVLSVITSNSLINMSRVAILTFLPIYLSETLGFSSLKLGIYLALLYVMGIVSQPIMGIISDKMGRKIILVPSFLIMGIIFLLLSITQNDIILAIIIGILGAFFYPILNIAQTAIMDVANKDIQATSMGITGLVSWPFILISPIVAGLLVDKFNIEIAFIYAGLIALISGLIILPVKFKTLN